MISHDINNKYGIEMVHAAADKYYSILLMVYEMTRINPSSVPTNNNRRIGNMTALVTCILLLDNLDPLRSYI